MKNFIVAPAPHAHSGDSVRRNMLLVILALLPAYAVSVIEFGVGALITAAISVCACVLTEWCISRFLLKEQRQTIGDLSAVLTGLLLAFNLPSSLDWWIVLIGAVVAIGVGKMSFGGLGQNPFNPALVGRVFLLISFPAQMTTWPVPQGFNTSYLDAETGATPLYYLKHIAKTGDTSLVDQLPAALFAWIGAPAGMPAGQYVAYELLSGGLMLGAFFMATDYVTSPMSAWGKIIFGIGIGFIMMVIRTWGAYPEGMSFAILIMNACVPLLNKIRPQRFGEKKK